MTCKTPEATPDKRDLILAASQDLSAISVCLAAIGGDLMMNPNAPRRLPDGVGHALEWLSVEIERRCALIDEELP